MTLIEDQRTGKRGEKDLSNSQKKRVGADRQLCCDGLRLAVFLLMPIKSTAVLVVTSAANNSSSFN